MKQAFFFLLFNVVFSVLLCAQNIDSAGIKRDSSRVTVDSSGLNVDTVGIKTDSLQRPTVPGLSTSIDSANLFFHKGNKLLNSSSTPVSLSVQIKKENSKDSLFYLVTAIVLLLAVFKYFYNRYFTNLFRVFFNTSLRQSQLTDQLLQAKFPSLVFNLFFVISGGFYIYILLLHYHWIDEGNKWLMIGASIAILGFTYLVKFCTLKFTGWVTGLTEVTNIYVFIIFLINKIIGIFLVPFIVILSFSDSSIVKIAVLVSLMSIGLLILLRFFRSYGLLQNQLRISRFHFILYIAGIELLPLLLIYKGLMIYLTKNL